MITKDYFVSLINQAKNQEARLEALRNSGIDLWETPIMEFGWSLFDDILEFYFTETGVDYINWWLWEDPEEGDLVDGDGELIPITTVDNLWEFVKEFAK